MKSWFATPDAFGVSLRPRPAGGGQRRPEIGPSRSCVSPLGGVGLKDHQGCKQKNSI